jgi:hypothetical protein
MWSEVVQANVKRLYQKHVNRKYFESSFKVTPEHSQSGSGLLLTELRKIAGTRALLRSLIPYSYRAGQVEVWTESWRIK